MPTSEPPQHLSKPEESPNSPAPGSVAAQNGHWRASLGSLLFLAGIFFVNFISRIIFGPLLVVIERDLHLSHLEAGALFFIVTLGYSLALLGSGYLASRLTHRRMIFISSLGTGAALGLLALPLPYLGLQVGLLLLGLAAGLYLPSGMATLTSIVAPRHWGKALAVHELAPNLGFVAAPFLAEAFLRWSSWRSLLLVFSFVSLLLGLAYSRSGKGGDFLGRPPTPQVVGGLFRDPSFWIMMVMFGLGIGTSFGVYAMFPIFLISERGLDRTWANTLIALSRVAGMFMAFAAGWLVDRWGVRKSLTIFLGATGLLTVLLGLLPDPWLTVTVFLQPLMAVCLFPAGFTAISRIGPPELRNMAVAFTVPLGFLIGGGVIPTGIGWAGEQGSFATGIIGTGLFTLLCLPLIRKIRLTAIAEQQT
ncbi:MAG: MFS transporter [Deltaproteobacteria bacterium]|nr:MFS transporter [Deltaproteobacteria bacterium]